MSSLWITVSRLLAWTKTQVLLWKESGSLPASPRGAAPVTFLSSLAGNNLLLKWQVLADALACSEHLVALLSRLEVVCKAKAFCLEAVKLAVKLQATRW